MLSLCRYDGHRGGYGGPRNFAKRGRRGDGGHRGYGGRDGQFGHHGGAHGGGGGHQGYSHGAGQPRTFREFMADLPNNATPEFAQREYQQYLLEFHGGEIRAEFERKKHDPEVRKRYHPTEIKKNLEEKTVASRVCAGFVRLQGLTERLHVPVGPYFYVSAIEGSENNEGGAVAKISSWDTVGDVGKGGDFRRAFPVTDDRRAQWLDFKVARTLIKKLDAECGIDDNALMEGFGEAGEDPVATVGKDDKDDEMEDVVHDDGEKDDGLKDGERMDAQNASVAPSAQIALNEDAATAAKYEVKDESFEARQLDELLQYLWVVHGVDYYGCKEYGFEADYARRNNHKRVVRPSQIAALGGGGEDGKTEATGHADEGDAAGAAMPMEQDGEGKELETAADAANAGEVAGNADGAPAMANKPEAPPPKMASLVDLITHENKVCQRWLRRAQKDPPSKSFIKDEEVEEELEKFIESQIVQHAEQKWGNKLSPKLFVAKNFVVKHIKNKHAHVLDAERERITERIYRDNYVASKEQEHKRNAAGGRGGRGGRGARGGRFGGGRGGPGPHGPPGGQIMYDAQGQAMVMIPVAQAGAMGGMGGRGRGRGGFGGRGRGRVAPVSAYFDIDAPKNNRAVLDYGDL